MNPASILAPAGNFESLRAALDAGADGIYFGAGSWNMRAGGAVNFQESELTEVVSLCHAHHAKAVLAVNTLMYDGDLEPVSRLCRTARESGVDACIAGDPAILSILRQLKLPVHITVQCNVTNLESVRFYSAFADVIVLARELPLGSIQRITDGIRDQNICGPSGQPVQIEVFAHGALCIGVSGRCGMSLCAYGKSANRGKCLQNCRRRYIVRDAATGVELELDNEYIMSPRDICTVRFLDRILAAGVSVLKIEGRGRPADYVYTTVSVYREARDACLDGTFTQEKANEWEARLKTVFNRGFWDGGYYLGNPLNEWSKCGGSIATYRKVHAGCVTDWYARIGIAAVKLESCGLSIGDKLIITGSKTGFAEVTVSELRVEDVSVDHAEKGCVVSFPLKIKVRPGDRVQVLKERIAEEEDERS